MKQFNLLITVSLMMLSVGMSAQPQGVRPTPPKQIDPKEIAKMEADRMKAEIALSDKQYKKVYSLILKDQKYRQSKMEERMGSGMPPQGGPGGMGGGMMGGGPGGMGGGMMGGGPGGMGGGMMGGGPGGMGGGMPSRGEMGKGNHPEGGRPGMGPMDDLVSEEYLEKQEEKLKKILSSEQYSKWRSNHPLELPELPEIEYKKN